MRYKILYLISALDEGHGGHFHSLNHISRKIGEKHEVKIISFGPGRSPVLESNPYFLSHIPFSGIDFFKFKRRLYNEINDFLPDIYHCFDKGSYNVIRLLVSSRTNKIVLNKCGGPNPVYFPHVQNLILFSIETRQWFKKHVKYKT